VTTAIERGEVGSHSKCSGIIIDADSLISSDVVSLVILFRRDNPGTALFVLARYIDLAQRLRLFDAGIDDCVRNPSFDVRLFW
jgi:hypothetical protein